MLLGFAITSSAAADGVPLRSGDVLVGEGNGLIKHFDPSGNLLDTLDTTSGSNEDTGMCFDQAGNLYTTNFEANSMSKFDSNGNLVAASFGSGFDSSPESCIFNNQNQVFVGQGNGSSVLQFDSSGNPLNSFSPALEDRGTDWVDLASDQCTLSYTSEGPSILRYNVCTNTQLPNFATNLPGGRCYGHRILPDGGELVACTTDVVRLDSSGNVVKTYTIPGSSFLFAMTIDPDGTSFWTSDYTNGNVTRVDIATGNVITSFNAAPSVDIAGIVVVGEQTVASDQKITASGASVATTEGQSFSGTVASFTDPDTNATAGDYSATINWGDGSTSTGTISGTGGNFTVSGSHTYAEEGSQTAAVTITDTDTTSNQASASSNVTVADAALHATGVVPSVSGTKASGTVATFTDSDPAGTVSDYTASINWGDGATTGGAVSKPGTGFAVSGSHTYAKSGTYTITTTIRDAGGATATATATIRATVKAATVVRGHASVAGIGAACVRAPFTVHVRGSQIASVRFMLGAARLHTQTVHRGKDYSAHISASPRAHTLTVSVKFRSASKTHSRTFHRTIVGCAAAPTFTG